MYSLGKGEVLVKRVLLKGSLSRAKVKTLPEWAVAVRRLRERLNLSQEGLARRLGLSISEVRRWDQGLRPPAASRAAELGKLAGPPDCWVFWELAGISYQDVLRMVGEKSENQSRPKRKSRRVSVETQEAAFSALELILERAPSAVIQQAVDFLVSRAGKYGESQ